ncbi:fibronectin type III domain-containing protein [Cohnella panacarvi]|uniref:fibronectin type III domain-containing protein n=1 Tax=Cohnella panacarvi TaxID=400776 RepID=UPI00047DE288|nr:fibronectin type III domain-containing protein [Cohnella panacarvi]
MMLAMRCASGRMGKILLIALLIACTMVAGASKQAGASGNAQVPSIVYPPTNLVAMPGQSQATLTWMPTTTSKIDHYVVYRRYTTETGFSATVPTKVSANAYRGYTVNLPVGETYEFKVSAVRITNGKAEESSKSKPTYAVPY